MSEQAQRQPESKPLHVQVAEALGWRECRPSDSFLLYRPREVGDWDGFRPGGIIQPPAREMVPRFDIDWSETGPLIERFRFAIHYFKGAGEWRVEATRAVPPRRGGYKTIEKHAQFLLPAICLLVLELTRLDVLPLEEVYRACDRKY